MTKLLYCAACGTMRSLERDGSVTSCQCGKMNAWWLDPEKTGTVRAYTANRVDRQFGRIIGMNNTFIYRAMQALTDIEHRGAHRLATTAPGYLFDASRRDCWACIIAPGESADTRWVSDLEWADKTGRLVEPVPAADGLGPLPPPVPPGPKPVG